MAFMPPPRPAGRRGGLGQPAEQAAAQRGLLGDADPAQRAADKGALARPPGSEAAVLKLAISLQDSVRVDGQRLDGLFHRRQPVPLPQVTKSERLLDLLNELQVGRHTRVRFKPESDRRANLIRPFIYTHR